MNCLKNEKIKEQNTGKMLDYEKYLKTLWSETSRKLIKKKTPNLYNKVYILSVENVHQANLLDNLYDI